MQQVLETLFIKFFIDTPFPFLVFLIGFFAGTYAWWYEVLSRRSRYSDLSLTGKGIQLVFLGTMWFFYVLVIATIVLTVAVFVITIAASLAYLIKVIIPEFMQSYEYTGSALAVLALCAALIGVALIYTHDSISEFIDRKFKRRFDPVKDCRIHTDSGCSHVDGYHCNKTCDKQPDYVTADVKSSKGE